MDRAAPALAVALMTVIGTAAGANASSETPPSGGVSMAVVTEPRPTVVPGPGSALVSWKGHAKRFRVDIKTKTGPWRHLPKTKKHRYAIDELNPLVKYWVAVDARQAGSKRWVRLGKRSKAFRPLPLEVPGGPTGDNPPAAGGPGTAPEWPPAGEPTPTGAHPSQPPTGSVPGALPEDPFPGDPAPTDTPPAGAAVTWVNPTTGSDDAAGSQEAPVRTLTEAWSRVPRGAILTQPHWIQLTPGFYSADDSPSYWEDRHGTADSPVVLNAAEGPRTARLSGDINAFEIQHMAVVGVDISRPGDVFHCERCSWFQLRRVTLNGQGAAHETVKVNQSDHITIADSDISGTYENAIDFVAVQYAAITGNRLHDADDWCAYAKGGSAYITVSGNEIYDCGTGGFTAGQGTGFEYMQAPWLRYETYGVTVTDNVIHDTEGAGLGVNGGYNTVMAFNTLYRVGFRSHTVEFVHGGRGCDGDTAACQRNHDAGGWGGVTVEGQWIPNKHVAFVNNIVFNPAGTASLWSHFTVHGPAVAPSGSNVPNPSLADDDLVIAGNVFSNGGADMDTGLSGPAAATFLATNRVNTLTPDLVSPGTGDFRPVPGGVVAGLTSVAIPAQSWDDSGVPADGDLAIPTDRPPGARR